MCGSTTHAVPNRPKPRACLRLTPYHPTNTASRSLHPRQPRLWLRHTPHLRTAQTLKPRCRVCAVRMHAFFGVKPLFQTFSKRRVDTRIRKKPSTFSLLPFIAAMLKMSDSKIQPTNEKQPENTVFNVFRLLFVLLGIPLN